MLAALLLGLAFTQTACGPIASLRSSAEAEAAGTAAAIVLSPEEHLRRNVAAAATTYLGARYVYGAKGPRDFDCSGFTSHVLRSFDIALLGSSMSQAKQGRSVAPSQAQPGDIVYFANASGRVNHVALVVANGGDGLEVIHATTSRGVVRDNITESSYWAPRLAGARCVADCRLGLAAAY